MIEQAPFVFGAPRFDTGKVFYARLAPEIYTKEQLLAALYYLLWLPGYFGFNWDALDECLRDLSWITEETVVLVHDRLPRLPDEQMKVYLTTLRDAVLSWRDDGAHVLEIVFKETDREDVLRLLACG